MFSVGFFRFLFAALACPVVFGKGGGVSTCEEGADVGKDGEDVSVLRANFSLCRSLR